jgi:hypothetical protein
MRKATLLFAALLATGLIAAGCGDDEDENGDGGEALTEQEFVAQADRICTEGDAEIEAQEQQLFGKAEPTQAEIEQFVTEIFVPGVQSQVDEIRELEAPEEIEGQVTEFVDSAEAGLDEVEQDPSVFGEGPQGADPFAETRQLASDLGLRRCAQ